MNLITDPTPAPPIKGRGRGGVCNLILPYFNVKFFVISQIIITFVLNTINANNHVGRYSNY